VDKLSSEKKIEVSQLFILNNSYAEITKKTGVSHGSISTIIQQLLAGQLIIPGTPSEEVSNLHQLSIDLVKNDLEPSQALLGITLYKRFTELGIVPAQFDQWAKLVQLCSTDDFPAKDFFEAALHLHELEEAEGKPFQEIANEYNSLKQKVGEMESEVESLGGKRKAFTTEVESLTAEVNALEQKKVEAESSYNSQCVELKETQSKVAEAQEEYSRLSGEIENLHKEIDKLQLEIGSKEESLMKLQETGLSEADLLHLVKLIEGIAEEENIGADQVKDTFFSSLSQFKNYSGLQKAVQEEEKVLKGKKEQKASLVGKIEELENRKAALQAEVDKAASGAAEQIRKAGEEAVSSIQKQTGSIKGEMKSILKDTLETSLAVGKMMAMQKNSEESGKELEALITGVKWQLGGK
jgi:chromosome segregation ATPase